MNVLIKVGALIGLGALIPVTYIVYGGGQLSFDQAETSFNSLVTQLRRLKKKAIDLSLKNTIEQPSEGVVGSSKIKQEPSAPSDKIAVDMDQALEDFYQIISIPSNPVKDVDLTEGGPAEGTLIEPDLVEAPAPSWRELADSMLKQRIAFEKNLLKQQLEQEKSDDDLP